ncbi:uncharacterized protein MONOS_9299 [Monocercomonoides exilis]|uniref:uncharacterized protein n=1 Tax=Monocercomonoides exilis TaxID=2049356 RepID=UPI003559D2C4|nr:hypothetical protein MONOS_9299 [Monocercomonoides exilis]
MFSLVIALIAAVSSSSIFESVDEYFEEPAPVDLPIDVDFSEWEVVEEEAEEGTVEAEEYFAMEGDEDDEDEEIDWDSFEAIQWCSICQEVAQFAEELVANHGSSALKNLILTKLCSKYTEICYPRQDLQDR